MPEVRPPEYAVSYQSLPHVCRLSSCSFPDRNYVVPQGSGMFCGHWIFFFIPKPGTCQETANHCDANQRPWALYRCKGPDPSSSPSVVKGHDLNSHIPQEHSTLALQGPCSSCRYKCAWSRQSAKTGRPGLGVGGRQREQGIRRERGLKQYPWGWIMRKAFK